MKILLTILIAFCMVGCASGKMSTQESAVMETDINLAPEAGLTTSAKDELSQNPPQVGPLQPEPDDEVFVRVTAYIPDIVVDLRYSTANNFTKQRIYNFEGVYLRYGTVKKLMSVQEELAQEGYCLKIWDGFRPTSAQFKLWEICPDPTYVSNPNIGFSSHSRGNTVDITLVNADGTELPMPTGFDDFSKLADRDYSDCDENAARSAVFLEELMVKHGFKPYFGEWWHYSDTKAYPVAQNFEPVAESEFYANCEEGVSLRLSPDEGAEVITRIPAQEQLLVTAKCGEFALVEYRHLHGYVVLEEICEKTGCISMKNVI